MRKSKRWRLIKGGVGVVWISSILLFMHTTLSPQGMPYGALSEDDIVVDDFNICYVDDDTPYYREPEAIVIPPLVHLDKLSDEDEVEEIFLSYPKHYPHTEYFDGPDVDEDLVPKNDPRNPVGKWVGKGLLSQPPGWWRPNREYSHNGCKVKTPRRVDEPATLWFILMFPLLYLLRKADM